MDTLNLWILLCCLELAGSIKTGGFCGVDLNLLVIRSCDSIPGPTIECSDDVVNRLKSIQRARISYAIQLKILGPSTRYQDFKILKSELRTLLTETQDFYDLLMERNGTQQNALGQDCVKMIHFERYLQQLKNKDSSASFEYWIEYYFPVITGLELAFGLLGNMLVMTVYARHKDMRTGPNTVILNLAFGDTLLLVTNTVVFYSRYRWLPATVASTICYVMSYSRTAGIASSVYSMVVLSVLRFLVTASTPGSKIQDFLLKYAKIPILLMLIWFFAGLTGILDAFNATDNCEFLKGTIRQYIRFVCICLLPLSSIAAFSYATSRIMRKSAEELPGEQTPGVVREMRARQRGAKVILSLVVVFCVTYLPLNIYFLVGKEYGATDHLYIFTAQLLIPLSSCLNPMALWVGSGKFRKHFNNYIFWSCKYAMRRTRLTPVIV